MNTSFTNIKDDLLTAFNDNNSSTSLDISKLNINEPVKKFANRINGYIDDIQIFKQNLENNDTKSENEVRCVNFCENLLLDHIKSLDQLDVCLNEMNNFMDKWDEAEHKIKDLEHGIQIQKDSRNDLKRKFEEDEQQNQEENQRKDTLINTLKAKIKKLENECNKLNEDKQDLLLAYQTEIFRLEKERDQAHMLNRKLMHDREIDELQYLDNKNTLTNIKLELCNLFNLASSYRRKTNLFGKQFINAFDAAFGKTKAKSKYNFSNITFLEQPSMNEDQNASYLNLEDIVYKELSDFNLILKAKLQNEEEISIEEKTFIKNNSDLILTGNLVGNFERLFGNETFNLESLNEMNSQNQSITSPLNKISNEILDDLVLEHIKYLCVKALFDFKKNLNQTNSACKDSIAFMFRTDTSLLNESYYEENHNKFEESFTENLARAHCSGSQPELLINILEGNNSREKKNISLIDSRIEEEDENRILEPNGNKIQVVNKNNLTRFVRKIDNDQEPNNDLIITVADKDINLINLTASSNENATLATTQDKEEELFTFNHNSEIQTLAKSKLLNFNATGSSSVNETANHTDLLVTLNKNFNRSDGESSQTSDSLEESINESSSINNLDEFETNSMQLTNFNNLSTKFNELSENQKLNSTVKTDERSSNEVKLNKTDSSDMSLSDDEEINFDDDCDSNDNQDDKQDDSDPFLAETIMSPSNKDNNFEKFYTTIKHDSDYSLMNMEVSDERSKKSSSTLSSNSSRSISRSTPRSARSKSLSKLSSKSSTPSKQLSNKSLSLSTLIKGFNDDNDSLNEGCNLHNSNSRCRFRKR